MNSKAINVRKISYNILFDVFIKKELLNNLIYEKYENNDISNENKSFIKRECTGVIENISNIDNVINNYSKVKTKKLDDDILILFRIAVFELFFMDKVPIYATINEIVNIVKYSKNKRLSGYVNATLRNIVRNKKILKDETLKTNKIKRCYFRIYGDNENKVLEELKQKCINFNKYDGKLKFIYSSVYFTDNYKCILDLENFKNGNIIIEDASSIYLVDNIKKIVDENFKYNEIKILDTCSAPGGKILSLVDILSDKNVSAIARDITDGKIKKINENIKRLNVNKIETCVQDATIYNNVDYEKYDIVLCDVPCTGLGVVNKKPDILLNYNDKKRNSLVEIQKKIINVSKKYVKKSGVLSYSTCTTTKEENEDMVYEFLKENKDFSTIFEKRIEPNDDNFADGFYMNIMKKYG